MVCAFCEIYLFFNRLHSENLRFILWLQVVKQNNALKRQSQQSLLQGNTQLVAVNFDDVDDVPSCDDVDRASPVSNVADAEESRDVVNNKIKSTEEKFRSLTFILATVVRSVIESPDATNLAVRLSVCPSVKLVHAWLVVKWQWMVSTYLH
jgi:hypothetical protein